VATSSGVAEVTGMALACVASIPLDNRVTAASVARVVLRIDILQKFRGAVRQFCSTLWHTAISNILRAQSTDLNHGLLFGGKLNFYINHDCSFDVQPIEYE
jgi:hypothetical protein